MIKKFFLWNNINLPKLKVEQSGRQICQFSVKLHQFSKIRQTVPLTDTAYCWKHFLSVLKFTTKVLLTIWQSVHPFGCYKRISGFVLRTVDFARKLKMFAHIKSILKVVNLLGLGKSFPLMSVKSLCDENWGRYHRFYNRN